MIVIDRFEGETAVIEDNGVILNIPRSILPEKAKEGSVLVKVGDQYELDVFTDKRRRASIKSRFDALRKK